jgi:hypothetical protein
MRLEAYRGARLEQIRDNIYRLKMFWTEQHFWKKYF